jgi:hypothetical protein
MSCDTFTTLAVARASWSSRCAPTRTVHPCSSPCCTAKPATWTRRFGISTLRSQAAIRRSCIWPWHRNGTRCAAIYVLTSASQAWPSTPPLNACSASWARPLSCGQRDDRAGALPLLRAASHPQSMNEWSTRSDGRARLAHRKSQHAGHDTGRIRFTAGECEQSRGRLPQCERDPSRGHPHAAGRIEVTEPRPASNDYRQARPRSCRSGSRSPSSARLP